MEYVIIFLTLCVIDGTVWLFLWCAFYLSFFPRRREIEVVVRCRREDEGVDKGSVSLGFSEMRLGRKKKGGEEGCLLWEKALEEATYLAC